MLVILDRTRGTGRFNVAQGALATTVGVGAALSNALGGELVDRFGYNASFLGLGAIAALAFCVLWYAVPETLPHPKDGSPAALEKTSSPASPFATAVSDSGGEESQ